MRLQLSMYISSRRIIKITAADASEVLYRWSSPDVYRRQRTLNDFYYKMTMFAAFAFDHMCNGR